MDHSPFLVPFSTEDVMMSLDPPNILFLFTDQQSNHAQAALLRNRFGFRKMAEDPDSLAQANAHIRVPVGTV